ncbi:MAG: hypothetical protein ABSA83_20195 [Verrucomicrobiota bacterium]|jgi:hypothetical protein
MEYVQSTETPEAATGKSKLAVRQNTNCGPQVAVAGTPKPVKKAALSAAEQVLKAAEAQQSPTLPGLWDIEQLMAHVPVCRRSIHNLRKKGLPTIVLGRRLFWHPPSVQAWLLRQQRGGEQ